MLKFSFLLVVLITATVNVAATDIRIGLYNGIAIESIVFSSVEGGYDLIADGRKITRIQKGNMFHIERQSNLLTVSDTAYTYGNFSDLKIQSLSPEGVFQVKAVIPNTLARESDGNLEIIIRDGNVRLINTLDLEKYIPGTVESEGGSVALPEYYKAQAVLARTYAMHNFYRHAHEGFNLCDGVHCQAYNGKSRMNREIYQATKDTEDEILVDTAGHPIVTAYHANCGGLTGSSQIVWNRNLSYLQPVHDPFCDKSSHRNWSRTITKSQWLEFLNKRGYKDDPVRSFSTENGRQKYLIAGVENITMADVRQDFGLKSSWFHAESSLNSVVLTGHGYGHGLGMCQQGAMEMARRHYCYVDILMFYFRGVGLSRQIMD